MRLLDQISQSLFHSSNKILQDLSLLDSNQYLSRLISQSRLSLVDYLLCLILDLLSNSNTIYLLIFRGYYFLIRLLFQYDQARRRLICSQEQIAKVVASLGICTGVDFSWFLLALIKAIFSSPTNSWTLNSTPRLSEAAAWNKSSLVLAPASRA